MEIKAFTEKLFTMGREAGYTDMEVYVASKNQFAVRIFKSEIDSYNLAESRGLSFRGIINEKMGYSYTEHLGEESIEFLLKDAAENANIISSGDVEAIFSGSPSYASLNTYSQELEALEPSAKIAWAKNLEEKACALDERIFSVQVQLGNSLDETLISNTRGLDVAQKGNYAMGFVSVVVKDGKDTKNSYSYVASRDFSTFDAEKLARKTVEESLSLLGAEPVDSGEYSVVLRHDVAATFLSTFASSFSAEAVQKGLSLLKDRVGEIIVSPLITITDDPFLADRPWSSTFDAEGVATKQKHVIESGKLLTFLHNSKTARKEGLESTGNAFKASYNSPVSVSPTNFYIAAGDKTYDELLQELDNGLVIIALQGTHAGANPVSGDFSLSAYGYEVKGGKISRPVNQITIAGNFFKMLADVKSVGKDIEFGMSNTGAPSLLVSSLSVAGK